MSKKKKKPREFRLKEPAKYEDMPALHGIIHEDWYNVQCDINVNTISHLGETWVKNIKNNVSLWKKQVALRSLEGLAKNKCVVGIGGGPSFNINKDILKETLNHDGVKEWEDRDFVTIASNHQYKPLLKMGIIPDFVLLVDAADTVYDQLCTDIPESGQNTTLITGIHCSNKILSEWTKQGRQIAFYVTPAPDIMEDFKKYYRKNPKYHKIELGGNCLNGAWMIGIVIMKSTVFIGVGNDLSYPIKKSLEDQRSSYYADGDYSSNAKETGSGRDEAKTGKKWAGFALSDNPMYKVTGKKEDRYHIQLDTVGTSYTLWVYKNWLETTLLNQLKNKNSFHYFNCSEGGILGVMSRTKYDNIKMKDKDNWYMFDEVCRFYHTAKLKDAVYSFLQAKEAMECHNRTLIDAQDATRLVVPSGEDIVGSVNRKKGTLTH
jgi:hypothetical protein